MKKTSERPKYNMWQCTWYMISLAWKRRRKCVPLFCLALAALQVGNNLLELLIAPAILSKVEHVAPLGELLWTIGGFIGALILVSGLRRYVETVQSPYQINVRLDLVRDLDYKLNTTSYPHIHDAKFHEQLQRCNMALGNNDAPGEATWGTLTNLLKSIAGFILYLLLLSSLNPVMLGVILVTTVGGYFANKHLNEWGYRHRAEEESYINHTQYALNKMEDRKLSKDIRIFGMQDWLEDLYRSALRLYQGFLGRRERVYLWTNVIDVALTFLRNGIAYFYLISMALRQDLSAAQFLLYFSAVSGFTGWITEILSQFTTLHKQCLELSVLLEVMHWPEPFRFEDGEAVSVDPALPYELRLDHVSFRYPGAETDTLHDVCLTIPAGEKLAIVGLNGAGKTTLVKLLCGLYDPTEGRVLLGGKDIRTFNRRQYYGLFSAVFQDFSILPITLRENVAQRVDAADTQRIWACLAQAGLVEKVKSMPQGLDTPIGREVFEDGVELSGGETQRLMLARALYKDGPILLLDEPTAALDPIAENDIYLKYNSMTAGRTSVFISHRLASTRFCDRILFLADGGIAEDGTHDTLMAQGGQYAALFQVQSKYYQEGSECI